MWLLHILCLPILIGFVFCSKLQYMDPCIYDQYTLALLCHRLFVCNWFDTFILASESQLTKVSTYRVHILMCIQTHFRYFFVTKSFECNPLWLWDYNKAKCNINSMTWIQKWIIIQLSSSCDGGTPRCNLCTGTPTIILL